MPLLFLTDFYPPGFSSGGPSRSCYNLSVGLGSIVPVQVLTRDRDLGSRQSYPEVRTNEWIAFAPGVEVCYLSPTKQDFWAILQKLQKSSGSVLYLNSMFSVPFTIYPLLAHWLRLIQGRVILAPRGMLKASALQFKSRKKKLFLAVFKALGWHRFITFHASSVAEAADIQTVFGPKTRVFTCPPVPELGLIGNRIQQPKLANITRFCIIGRVHPIKNIHKALELLACVENRVHVDIVGLIENTDYYAHCQSILAGLPDVVQVHCHGALPRVETLAILQQTDFFYLLTQGENFGHAIFEALALGKPGIISDQTPWQMLAQKKAGWDLPLEQDLGIQEVLKQAIKMEDKTYQIWSSGAFALAQAYVAESDWLECYKRLFFPEA